MSENKFIPYRKQSPEKSGSYLIVTEEMRNDSIFVLTYELDMDDGEKWGYWEQYFDPDTLGWCGEEWKPFGDESILGWMPIPDMSDLEESDYSETIQEDIRMMEEIDKIRETKEKILEEAKKFGFRAGQDETSFHETMLDRIKQQGIEAGWFNPETHILSLEKEGDTVRIVMSKKPEG